MGNYKQASKEKVQIIYGIFKIQRNIIGLSDLVKDVNQAWVMTKCGIRSFMVEYPNKFDEHSSLQKKGLQTFLARHQI